MNQRHHGTEPNNEQIKLWKKEYGKRERNRRDIYGKVKEEKTDGTIRGPERG